VVPEELTAPKAAGATGHNEGMRRALASALAALTTLTALPVRGAGTREHVRFSSGVTPGGLVWAVSMKTERIVLRATDGTARGSYPLAPDERYVLGVADDGTRVSARRPWGVLPVDDDGGTPKTQTSRLDFRGPSGELVARRTLTSAYGATPAIVGAEAHVVRRDGRRLTITRVSAAEAEAVVAAIPTEPIVKELGARFDPKLFASSAGLVLQLEGGGRTAYVVVDGKPRTIFADPALSCGWSGYHSLHPNGSKGVSRIGSRPAPAGSRTTSIAVLETLDADGHLVRSAPLGPQAPFTPLEGGELLATRPGELIRYDDRGNEISRVPFSLDPDRVGTEALAGALQRLRTRGAAATGRDWAELALLPDAPLFEFRDVVARDARGALARLAEVADGDPSVPEARSALRWILTVASSPRSGGASTNDTLAAAIALVESGGRGWLRRAVAFPALTALRQRAPAWTLPAIAEAVVRGEGGDEALALPGGQLTPELTELIVALDRSRMDRLDRDGPPPRGPLLLMDLPDPDAGRFHLPTGPGTAGLVDCFADAGPIRFQAALEALAGPAMEEASRRLAERRGRSEPATPELAELGEASSRIVARLIEARHAADPSLRAGALLLGPFYGIPVDAESFRRDVLARPDTPLLSAGALTFDTSLPPETWKRLFGESLAAARAQSPDPLACTRASAPDWDRDDDFDPYCVFVEGILRFAQSPPDADGDDLAPRRAAEIGDWSRSGSAPPELRAQALIARILEGNAPDDELSAAWRDTSRPFRFRRTALQARLAHLSPGAAEEWRRELRGGRGSSREEAALIGALALVDRSEAARLAADGVLAGKLDAPRAEATEWLDALDPAEVAGSARLRDALRARLGDEEIGPEVAALLGRAGDRQALPHLATALRTLCLRCLGKEALLAMLEPFGAEGYDLLETLGRTVEAENAATALDALFEVDPSRAGAAAEERLTASLSADCVPQGLVRLLVRRDRDPLPAVAARLATLDCRRDALRPAGTLRVEDDPDAETSHVKRAAAGLFPPACRESFESLFGIGEKDR